MARARNLNISRKSSNQEERRNVESNNQVRGQNYANRSLGSGSTEQNQDQIFENGPNTQQQNEERTYEYVIQDPDGKRTRGKTVLADIWNLPEGHRVVVEINKSNQPIGDEGGVLGYFCGTVARNGGLCSLSYTRWDYLKKGNKGNNQTLILNEVQERSKKSKLSHKKAKTKPIHTSGTKSHARIYEDLKKSLQRSPTRTELYLECHQHKKEANVTDQIKELAAAQQGHLEENLNDDPVAQVLGKDQYGRVRGFGLGFKPSDLSGYSGSRYFSGLNMSTNEETTSMYFIRQLKDQFQALENRVIKQGNFITKLKRKLRNNEGFSGSDLDSSGNSSEEGSSDEDSDGANNE